MNRIIAALVALSMLPATAGAQAAHKPKLVVNIVVSQMRCDWLTKFERNFSPDGFLHFKEHGADFTSAYYNYMQTLSPASLATLTTGTNPSMHGVVSTRWIDYTTGQSVSLIDDPAAHGLDCEPGTHRYSNVNITMPTLGDKLLSESPRSKVITIASDPVSAIVMGGRSGQVYWMDESRAVWTSSTCYMNRLPEWVVKYNGSHPANFHMAGGWPLLKPAKSYVNTINTIFTGDKNQRITSFRNGNGGDCPGLMRTPCGSSLTADFAKQAVVNERLGTGEHTDILNICFDAPRLIGCKYGNGSMEVEDMIYRIDADLAELVRSITSQVNLNDVLFVITSDHGVSDAWDEGAAPRDRFNPNQFKTILNSFLSVQFGTGEWVLDYIDRQVYLNHNLIYGKNLSLEEVQNRAAAFALQFRGVSHAMTATAMQNGYFGDSYGHLMQNGFYPRRAGDLMLNFMPGWIEERTDARSLPGSMYDYDTHVPLIVFGWKVPARQIDGPVDMTAVAPTLARILHISRPAASNGTTIPELDILVK